MIIVNDAIEWVRSRPEQFFPSGRVEPIYLLSWLMADVIELGSGECLIRHMDSWWIIGSDLNWLRHEKYTSAELFAHVVPAPERGEDHTMRSEVIVGAFAKDICVYTRADGAQLIQGELPPLVALEKASDLQYAVLFSM